MKPQYRRCLILALILILFISAISTPAFAASTDIPFSSTPWCYTVILPEGNIIVPNTIIIYLPGAGHTGLNEDSLENFARANHPVKYSREDLIPMPDDCAIVCLQAHGEGDFSTKQDQLCEIFQTLSDNFPDTTILLAGHSNGALATYKIAASINPDIDGYIFISGLHPKESEKLSLIPNCLVVYGYENMVAHRTDFSNLFYETDISDKKYAGEIAYVEEVTNNAYFVNREWTHGTAPEIFQEDFFWEWVNNIDVLTEENN